MATSIASVKAFRAHMEPKEINEWLGVGGAISAIAIFIWRKALLGFFRWICNAIKAPARINEMAKTLESLSAGLHTATALSRATWDALSFPVWHSDASGLCVHVNASYREILKVQFSDVSGDSWRSIIYQDDRELVWREWDSAIKQNRDFDLSYRWISKEGEIIPIHARASRLLAADGKIAGWVAFVTVLPSNRQHTQPIRLQA